MKYKTKIKTISAKNDKIRQLKQMIKGSCPDADKLFLIEGIAIHQQLIRTNIEVQSFLFCPECIYSNETSVLAEQFITKSDEVYVISKKTLQSISDRDRLDGLISIGLVPVYDQDSLKLKKDACILVLDGLENPGNIGTILRTCDGAGVDAVFICNKKARMTNPKLVKSSMGAVFVVPVIEFEDSAVCLSWLKNHRFSIYLADTRAEEPFHNIDYQGRSALIVGSERYGVSKNWYHCDAQMLFIPMHGICDSLNVGTAASIFVYQICMKRQLNKE